MRAGCDHFKWTFGGSEKCRNHFALRAAQNVSQLELCTANRLQCGRRQVMRI
jgi:hypothetical protein